MGKVLADATALFQHGEQGRADIGGLAVELKLVVNLQHQRINAGQQRGVRAEAGRGEMSKVVLDAHIG